jgi:hypothetical protein
MEKYSRSLLRSGERIETSGGAGRCTKCDHPIAAGDLYYRDVATGKHAHIMCRSRKIEKVTVAA